MTVIEAASRGGALFLLLLVAVLLLRDARRVPAAVLAALFALGVASYTVVSASSLAGQYPPWLWPLKLMAMGNPAILCLFAKAVFDDEFEPSAWHALAWLAVVGLGSVCLVTGPAPSARLSFSVLELACNALAAWYALAGRAVDLVEARRRLRVVLMLVVALYSAATVASEIAFPDGSGGATLAVVNSAGVLALTFLFAVVQLSVNGSGLLISLGQPQASAPAAPQRQPPAPAAFPAAAGRDEDAPLLAALRRLMEHDKAYREEGLSIGSLAERLGTSEHGLRRLINQRLGHRNFNAFLNGYRLDEVEAALADPAQESVPILTIALDSGFQSLGPFNRAFKARTGMTPSEFRRFELGRGARTAAE